MFPSQQTGLHAHNHQSCSHWSGPQYTPLMACASLEECRTAQHQHHHVDTNLPCMRLCTPSNYRRQQQAFHAWVAYAYLACAPSGQASVDVQCLRNWLLLLPCPLRQHLQQHRTTITLTTTPLNPLCARSQHICRIQHQCAASCPALITPTLQNPTAQQ